MSPRENSAGGGKRLAGAHELSRRAALAAHGGDLPQITPQRHDRGSDQHGRREVLDGDPLAVALDEAGFQWRKSPRGVGITMPDRRARDVATPPAQPSRA